MDEVQLRMRHARQVLDRCLANLDEYLDGDEGSENKTRILRELEYRRGKSLTGS